MTDSATNSDESRLVTLVRGVMERGGFYWCYVAVKPELLDKFQSAIKNKYNIQNFVKDGYGEVIVSGTGRTPPQDVTDKVAQIFGISPDLLKEGNYAVPVEAPVES